jgi:hypothetical protein
MLVIDTDVRVAFAALKCVRKGLCTAYFAGANYKYILPQSYARLHQLSSADSKFFPGL